MSKKFELGMPDEEGSRKRKSDFVQQSSVRLKKSFSKIDVEVQNHIINDVDTDMVVSTEDAKESSQLDRIDNHTSS